MGKRIVVKNILDALYNILKTKLQFNRRTVRPHEIEEHPSVLVIPLESWGIINHTAFRYPSNGPMLAHPYVMASWARHSWHNLSL